ncbi:MAG: UDP-N-acetylmuramoyl-L-alanine--D-glutamate ligase [Armatimonadota bacterium]|nr:UDP-N-acetylmuramoyl-L-alanine--D-glutamate ligase [Armatimonadota bacterium]MDR5696677.1 UDP-N-acetylmuramoyl-L-alanine--D-glutamate ligase [Armatimonadota bacterium]
MEALEGLRGKRIHVLGISGTEGCAVARFLLAQGIESTCHDLTALQTFPEVFARTHAWMARDERERIIRWWLSEPVPVRWRDRYLEGIERAEVIFLPQAWFRHPENAPVRERLQAGVRAHSMTQLVFDLCPCPIVGVTGTNGKFTVATLIHRMLTAAGLRAHISGNDRTHVPILYRMAEVLPTDRLVLEISNRQLLGLRSSPQVAVLTNIQPHHLDDHGTFEAYVRCKAGIFRHQRAEDFAVVNLDDPASASLIPQIRARLVPFRRAGGPGLGAGAWLAEGWILTERGTPVVAVDALLSTGDHVLENALAACAACSMMDVPPQTMADVLRRFEGLPYRMQVVAEHRGVRYVNDSLATNPSAAAAAIRAMRSPFVLIAGGVRHNATAEDFAPMAHALRASPVRAVYLIGRCARAMAEAFGGLGAEVVDVGTLPQAFRRATNLARPGEVVLLSPGCESFDQFADYRERGDVFDGLVRAATAQRHPEPERSQTAR